MNSARVRQSPFGVLVVHFVRRLFAGEAEQDGGGMGLGLGAILAILASPGAFASIFLMGKYSTLLQFIRGEYIDAIGRSPLDEYFFIVLSMTITGLVMVARWNRLFPDCRDFSNLAILPIPIRNIFLANLVALTGLAIIFALDVNVISAMLFPLFVMLSYDRFGVLLHVGVAHAVTVFSASLFSFFAVFALVGILLLVVPQRMSRIVSILVRVCLVVGLLTEFYSDIFVQLFAGHLPGQATAFMRWVPSYWFLGIYETIMGIAKPGMVALGRQALLALAVTIAVAGLAYALCYRRIFMRLPETFDSMGSSRPFFQVRLPESLLRPLFRSPFERAASVFAAKALLRSEQHLMFFGAYLGVGLVIVTQTALDGVATTGRVPNAQILAIPLLVAFFTVSGLRFVFDMAAVPSANWVFQTAANAAQPVPRSVAKRLLLWATLPWQLLLVLPWMASHAGWRLAFEATAATVAFTVFFVDLVLLRFRKVPFTCSTDVDVRTMLLKILATMFAVLLFVPNLGALERWMLLTPVKFAWLALALGVGWYWMHQYRSGLAGDDAVLQYRDGPAAPFELMKLT